MEYVEREYKSWAVRMTPRRQYKAKEGDEPRLALYSYFSEDVPSCVAGSELALFATRREAADAIKANPALTFTMVPIRVNVHVTEA